MRDIIAVSSSVRLIHLISRLGKGEEKRCITNADLKHIVIDISKQVENVTYAYAGRTLYACTSKDLVKGY